VLAWTAVGAAVLFTYQSEQQLAGVRSRADAVDRHARAASLALSELRAGQQAYVALGQGVELWRPKTTAAAGAARDAITLLQGAATTPPGRSAVDDASATLVQLNEIDAAARDYLDSDEPLMAGDILFSDGAEAVATAVLHVETARAAEREAADAAEASLRRRQAVALAAAGGLAALMALLLGVPESRQDELSESAEPVPVETAETVDACRPEPAGVSAASAAASTPIGAAPPILRAAAHLSADLACVRDVDGLRQLLARASDVLDAAGMVIWLGDAEGMALQPVFTHGYSDEACARLPRVPRMANNAAAAAFRSGQPQIVASRPGGPGAIVAPIRGTDGCIGAFSAEIRCGGETSESVQALAAIIAAQLAGVLTPSRADRPEPEAHTPEPRAAASAG
jgi:hypothetical protein